MLLRHAQTEYGERHQLMGILDEPCSELGRAKARSVGQYLGKEKYFRVYSSPLIRAIQTAHDVFPQSSITIEHSLVERNLGDWAGKTLEEVVRGYPQAFSHPGYLNPFYTPKNGEPIENVISRVKSFIDKLRDLHKAVALENLSGENYPIAIVTHNGVIRVIRCILENIPLFDMYNQTEIYLEPIVYTYDGVHWTSGNQTWKGNAVKW